MRGLEDDLTCQQELCSTTRRILDRAVIALDLAIAVVGAEPLVDDLRDRDAATEKIERKRQLPSGVTTCFDVEAHPVSIYAIRVWY